MFWRKPKPLPRYWFQGKDGTYYRNATTISEEMDIIVRKRDARYHKAFLDLTREFDQAHRVGVIRKAELEPGDVLAEPMPFREAYPNHPGLWTLDEWKRS